MPDSLTNKMPVYMEDFICRYPLNGNSARNRHQILEAALINEISSISILPYHIPEYFPPSPDYITTHEEVLGSPVLCTALLTLTMLSSWRSSPAPPWLVSPP